MKQQYVELARILKTQRRIVTFGMLLVALSFGLAVSASLNLFGPGLWSAALLALGGLAALLAVVSLQVSLSRLRRDGLSLNAGFRRHLSEVNRDALTGVLNRAQFLAELGEQVRRNSDRQVAYVQIDLDHLKAINDGVGHAAGDAALKHLVSAIRAVVPDALIGRLGGDEFAVALFDCNSTRPAQRLCEQINERVKDPLSIDGRKFSLSATMGIACFPGDARSVDELISNADLALYKGKKMGRRRAVVFERDMYADKRYERSITRELRAAILLDELDVYYQPIFASDGKTLRAYESLVRWQHPVRGLISPGEFIAIAEKSDLIDDVGYWVLKRACRDLPALAAPYVSVNVSVSQLRRPGFADEFKRIAEESGVNPSSLMIEVTESVPLNAGGVEATNLRNIQALGVRIAIDDFGAGNASLSYIRQFRFDVLKIDKSYIESIATSRMDAMLVGAVCRIARAADMEVVAEGVETREQLETLGATSCCSMQGYLLGRPEPLQRILYRRSRQVASAA